VACVARSTATTDPTCMELSDPSTKCKNFFHYNDTRTLSHPLWRMMEFSGFSFPRELLIGEGSSLCQTASAPSHRQLYAQLRTNAHLACSNQRSDKFTPHNAISILCNRKPTYTYIYISFFVSGNAATTASYCEIHISIK